MSMPHDDPKTQTRADGAARARIMAHPDPRLAETSRYMAHPVRFGNLRKALAGPTARLRRSPVIASSGVPRPKRHRDLALVIALLAVAVLVSASLPGGWAGASSASQSVQAAVASAYSSS